MTELTRAIGDLLPKIRSLIASARGAAARSVNILQVLTNFEIGRLIVEHEQEGAERAVYGKALLQELSTSLTDEFGRGFSHRNLDYMRKFYLTYRDREPQISQTVSAKLPPSPGERASAELAAVEKTQTSSATFALSWSHYVFLISIENPDERAFYEIEASAGGWTLAELKRQFNSGLYERLALSRGQDAIRELAREGQIVAEPKDVLKSPYVLEFLGLEERPTYSESDLESAIIDKLEHFLLGQMQMYVNYFDRHVKTADERPTVGIILCKKKHEALVEITLPEGSSIYASEYQLYLPSKEQLRQKLLDWAQEGTE